MQTKILTLKQHLQYALFLPFVLAMWSVQTVNAFEIAIGNEQSPTYGLGISISSLVKVKLLPTTDIDLEPVITTGDQASLEALRSGAVAFALVSIDRNQRSSVADIRALAILGMDGSRPKTLLARSDVDDAQIQNILQTIFNHIDYLAAIEPELRDLDSDSAVVGLTLPLHGGAKRFYASRWASPNSNVSAEIPAENKPGTVTAALSAAPHNRAVAAPVLQADEGPLDARNYILYFGFDDASLNDAAQATLREAATFAATLETPGIIVAGYTDSVGNAEYNYLLAERRAQSVIQGLEALDVQYSRLDLSLFGERSPWAVTLDNVNEAGNRRVELFIEKPVPEVQPLHISSGLPDSYSAGHMPASPQSERSPETIPQSLGGPEQRILPSGSSKQLM
jgi:outer membrane protein OmpA-like peptidoglycan-associated protein